VNTTPQPGGPAYHALADALHVSFNILRAAMALIAVLYIFSGIVIVHQHERAFILIFGRLHTTGATRSLGPGFHWSPPPPIGQVIRVPAERVQTINSTGFWYAESHTGNNASSIPATLNPLHDGYCISGDAGIFHSRWALRYTISDPYRYVFAFRDPQGVLSNELEHAVLKVALITPIDAALRTGREACRAAVTAELQRRCNQLQLGVSIQRVDLSAALPPRQVKKAFDAVVEAGQERSQIISRAQAYADRTVNDAHGRAARIIAEGRAYRRDIVSRTHADADYFSKVLTKYRAHPSITARTLWQDAVRRAINSADEKYVIEPTPAGRRQLRIIIGQASPPSQETSADTHQAREDLP